MVAVVVDPGSISGSVTIDANAHPFLAISVVDGKVKFTKSEGPFRYM